MDYDETWEAMSNLEDSFNRIIALETMLEDLQKAVDKDDRQEIIDTVACCNAFMPVYVRQYQDASNRAWNKTVRQCKPNRYYEPNYDEIKRGLEENDDLMWHPV